MTYVRYLPDMRVRAKAITGPGERIIIELANGDRIEADQSELVEDPGKQGMELEKYPVKIASL